MAKDIFEGLHLQFTLTTDDSFRPFFRQDSRLLGDLLRIAAQAVRKVIVDLNPGIQVVEGWSGLVDEIRDQYMRW
jgi:hypothetical protein